MPEAMVHNVEEFYPVTPEAKSIARGIHTRYEYECESDKKPLAAKTEPEVRPADRAKLLEVVQRMQARLQNEKVPA